MFSIKNYIIKYLLPFKFYKMKNLALFEQFSLEKNSIKSIYGGRRVATHEQVTMNGCCVDITDRTNTRTGVTKITHVDTDC